MGGFGSGRRVFKKEVVEGCRAIDTADLNRWNLLKAGTTDRPGSLHWRRGGEEFPSSSVGYSLTVGDFAGTLRLTYTLKAGSVTFDYPIRLVATPCHLGGVRWWFACPLAVGGVACGRRVRKLHLRDRYFGCRHCHRLTYTSTQESDGRVYSALRGGLDFSRFGGVRNMSVAELGIALKAFTLEERRMDRLLRRSGRKSGCPRATPAQQKPEPETTPVEEP